MQIPVISIIVPVYGAEDFLDRCIKSILVQDYEDYELILVNDASPDRSGEVMENWARRDSRIRTIHLPMNLRQGGARNRGLDIAQGEFIYFVDSDDWIAPHTLSSLVDKQKEYDADMVGFEYRRARSEQDIYDDPHTAHRRSRLLPLAHGNVLADAEHELLYLNTAGVWNNLYKRSIIETAELRFPEGLAYEDNAFVKLYTIYTKRYDYLPEPFYYYFGNPQSTTKQINSPWQFDRLEIEELKLRELTERGFRERYREAIDFDFLRLYYLNSLGVFFRRDEIPWDLLRSMRQRVKEVIPEVTRNPYYQSELRKVERAKWHLGGFSLRLLALLYRVTIRYGNSYVD